MGPPGVTMRQASPSQNKKKKSPSKLIKLNLMDSKRLVSPIMGIFCGGLNAYSYCMQTRPLFLRCGSCGSFATCVFRKC